MLAHCERILTRGERVARARKEIDDTSHEHTEATKRTTENVGCLEAVAGESRGSAGETLSRVPHWYVRGLLALLLTWETAQPGSRGMADPWMVYIRPDVCC